MVILLFVRRLIRSPKHCARCGSIVELVRSWHRPGVRRTVRGTGCWRWRWHVLCWQECSTRSTRADSCIAVGLASESRLAIEPNFDFRRDTKVLVDQEVGRDFEGQELWNCGWSAQSTLHHVRDAIVANHVHARYTDRFLDESICLEAVRSGEAAYKRLLSRAAGFRTAGRGWSGRP